MNFEQAMRSVEEKLAFPEHLADFHNQRTRRLFAETGLAESLTRVPTVVVTGSCGKASTAYYLAYTVAELLALTGSDREVGLGTKPPLSETLDGHRERYQLLQGAHKRWIEPEEFASLVGQLPTLPSDLAPYDLRYWILGRWFVEREVGLGIVEANIGFRLDPASVFPRPVAQLLTPIGVDHIGLLLPTGAPSQVLALGSQAGPTWHKACCPTTNLVLSGVQTPQVAEVVQEFNPRVKMAGRDFEARVVSQSLAGSRVRIRVSPELEIETDLPMIGRHQAENAALAAACVWELNKYGVLPGSADQVAQAIETGLSRATIPGRLERLNEEPMVLLNAATGVIKIEGMMTSLEELVKQERSLWVMMSVEARLIENSIPEWLDVCLRRLLGSTLLQGFTATAPGADDVNPLLLAEWAAVRAPKEVKVQHHFDPLAAWEECRALAQVVVLLGPSQAQLRETLRARTPNFSFEAKLPENAP